MKLPETICLESEAFEKLLATVAEHLREKYGHTQEEWLPEAEAMRLLNVSSKTTMSKWRSEGKLLYSQPAHKILLYSRSSILEFIEANSKHTF